ncbi:MAG: hypothetical protein RIE77_10385 [Phycisphaerales bacterium]|jgi:hypothetical protein
MTRLLGEGVFVAGRPVRDDRGRCGRASDAGRVTAADARRHPGVIGWLAFVALVVVGGKIWRWSEGLVAGAAGWALGGTVAVAALLAVTMLLSVSIDRSRRARARTRNRATKASLDAAEPDGTPERIGEACGRR